MSDNGALGNQTSFSPLILGGDGRPTATLYCGDCLKILPTLGKIDAIVTDPPYGVGGAPRRGGAIQGTLDYSLGAGGVIFEWDKRDDSWLALWEGPIACFCSPSSVASLGNAMKADGMLVYVKTNPHPCGSSYEPCLTRGMGVGGKHISAYNAANGQEHPTQKPIEVMRFIISRTKAASICDPFMGSGSTGVACVTDGRDFVGIEIEPAYFEIAERRIRAALAQPMLFQNEKAQGHG